jgi:hypothetical protein
MNSQHNKPHSVQSRHENQKMNRSKFSLTKTKQYVPLNLCLCVVCDNILLSKLKTLFGEEKKLGKQKLINPHEEGWHVYQVKSQTLSYYGLVIFIQYTSPET